MVLCTNPGALSYLEHILILVQSLKDTRPEMCELVQSPMSFTSNTWVTLSM